MELFYTPEDPGDFLELNEEESHHLIRVLRFQTGDEVILTNGRGTLFKSVIERADHKECRLRITEKVNNYGKVNYRLHIGIAPTKNIDRFEWFLEKATEIGIDEITPILCMRSERKEIKIDRLNKVIISAMKQSGKTYLPKLNALSSLQNVLISANTSQKFICAMSAKVLLKSSCLSASDSLVLIGPEGDFHPSEIELAVKSGFLETSLGPSRLRTETAGVVACSQIAFLNY